MRLQANAYFVGLGVPKDHALAKSLYEDVMRTEDDERGYAAYRLAVYYDQGLGGSPPEPASARKLYVDSMAAGHERTPLGLAPLTRHIPLTNCCDGRYNVAAAAGHASAEYNLALMFQAGEGGEQSHEQAKNLLQSAASHGDPQASYTLAMMHLSDDAFKRYRAGYGCICTVRAPELHPRTNQRW